MPSQITINAITGTSPYNITLCDTDPVSPTCVWIAQITDLDLPYTFSPPLSLQYVTNFLIKIVDSGFPCTIITPPVLRTLNPCYPIYVDAVNNQVYSFDPSTYATSSYFDPGVSIDAMTKNDDRIWIYSFSNGYIYEYNSTASTNPSLIRQIDTITNGIDIYGMCVFSSSTELLTLSSTGDVNVVDISTNFAFTSTTLYNIGGTPQNDCNLLRDDNIGITYLKTSSSGLKAFYDDGTQYSTATWPSGNQKGFFRDSSTAEIYGVNNTGGVYKIPQPPGSVTPSSITSISPDNLVSGGLGQSNTCTPDASSITVSLRNATAYTMSFTASSFTWINWGDSDYVSGSTSGATTISKTYSPAFTGDVTLNSYNLSSITGFRLGDSQPLNQPIGNRSPIIDTTQLSKLTNLSNYTTQNFCLTKGLVSYLPNSINYFSVTSSSLTGNTSDFPTGMTYCAITNTTNTLSGNVVNLPINLVVMFISGEVFSGNTSGFPSNLVWLRIDGGDTVSGDTSGLPSNLKYLFLGTSLNTISGNTSGLPSTLSQILIYGNNTISGDTSGIPRVDYAYVPENNNAYLTPEVNIGGNNTISGDTSGLPPEVRGLGITGQNTISGDTSGLPRKVTSLNIQGNNTISGNISGLPLSATSIYISGNNTITGDISGFTPTVNLQLNILGNNTISGDVSNIDNNIIYLNVFGSNTITGDISGIPSNVIQFQVGGNTTVYGDISGLPNSIINFSVASSNGISGPWSGFTSSTNLRCLFLPGGNMNTSSGSANGFTFPPTMTAFSWIPTGSTPDVSIVDDILVAATGTTWTDNAFSVKQLRLQGVCPPPSAIGLAAKSILTGGTYNLPVYTN